MLCKMQNVKGKIQNEKQRKDENYDKKAYTECDDWILRICSDDCDCVFCLHSGISDVGKKSIRYDNTDRAGGRGGGRTAGYTHGGGGKLLYCAI